MATEKPKIIFMTGRQSQHRIVVDTVRQINSRIPDGIPKITLIDIIGRKGCANMWIVLLENVVVKGT